MRALPNGAGGFVNKPTIVLGKGVGPPVPGTAMKRGIGTAAGGGGARPMTAVSGAGFNSKQNIGSSIDNSSAATITLEPKIETYYDHFNN